MLILDAVQITPQEEHSDRVHVPAGCNVPPDDCCALLTAQRTRWTNAISDKGGVQIFELVFDSIFELFFEILEK